MKHRTLLAIVAVLAMVTLSCGLTGGDDPEVTQPPAASGGEQPSTSSESGGEQPTTPPESGGEQPTTPPESGGGAEIVSLDTLDSYRLQMTWRGENEDGSESYVMTITEAWVKEPPARHLVMSGAESGSEAIPFVEMIIINDMTWMKMGDTWMQMGAGEGEDVSAAWEGLMTDVGDWTLVGEETVNGVNCKHYTSGGDVSFTVPDPQEGGTITINAQGESWVADQSDLPPVTIRERMQMEGGFFPMPVPGAPPGETGTIYLEYDVTDINAPITIEPPGDVMEIPGMPGETPVPSS
ncbi:MAG: hypothetical protein SXV54_14645 [Chloroflexota bacterium]|nr:hypothetical protein [Chloroflexota bacterium]